VSPGRQPRAKIIETGAEEKAPGRSRAMNAPVVLVGTGSDAHASPVRKSFVYRLYPTRAQASTLRRTLDECRWLYNHLLAQRKTAWDERQESLSLDEQQVTLPGLKRERPSLDTVHAQSCRTWPCASTWR
jgi:hypothetical protein